MLVYRTNHGRPIQLGDQFWHRARLFDIADLDNMVVTAKVSEAEYTFIQPGMPADIRILTMPDRVFRGEVVEVSNVAKDKSEGEITSWRDQNKKAGIQTFDVTIAVLDRSPYIKPNVEADVTISCRTIPDVLKVPLTAVFDKSGNKCVRVLKGRRIEERKVTLGDSAGEWTVVTSGLEEGEEVLLPVETEGEETS